MQRKMAIRWHLRRLMAERDMFATSDLSPLLAERGVVLSREQVYRLVTQTPERLNTHTLAAICDALGVGVADLIEVVLQALEGHLPARRNLGRHLLRHRRLPRSTRR